MGSFTLLPDATLGAVGWAVANTALHVTALSDSTDTTYITDNIAGTTAVGHRMDMGFATSALPTNAVVKKVTPFFRANQVSGNQRLGMEIRVYNPNNSGQLLYYQQGLYIRPDGTVRDYQHPAAGAWYSSPDAAHPEWTPQWLVDNLRAWIFTTAVDTASTGTDDHRVYKAWLVVEYDEQPVTSGLALSPAGINSVSTRPGFTYVFSDPEGSIQAARRLVIWSATDATETNCPKASATSFVAASDGTTRTAVAYSGTVSDPTEYNSSTDWQSPVDLAATGSYTLFVQVADQVNDKVRFSTAIGQLNWTQAITPPPTPTLSAPTWDSVNYRTSMAVAAANNIMSQDAADQELQIAGTWAAFANVSATTFDLTQFNTGVASRRYTATAIGNASIISSEFFPVKGLSAYSAHARVRSGAASRNTRLLLQYYTVAQATTGSLLGGSTVAATNAGWTTVSFNNQVAPANAAYVRILVEAQSAAAAENNYVDTVGIYPGTTAPGTWTRGGWTTTQRIVVERSVDAGVSWTALPQHSGVLGGVVADGAVNQAATVYDLATRSNVPVRYRAKTTSSLDGTTAIASAYTATVGPVTPVFDRFVLRDPTDPAYAMVLSISTGLDSTSEIKGAFYWPEMFDNVVRVTDRAGGERFSLGATFRSETEWLAFEAIRKRLTVLILQTDMDGVAYWVVFDDQRQVSLPISTARRTAATRVRIANFGLVQVNGPTGQPAGGPP